LVSLGPFNQNFTNQRVTSWWLQSSFILYMFKIKQDQQEQKLHTVFFSVILFPLIKLPTQLNHLHIELKYQFSESDFYPTRILQKSTIW
uniref:Uncharacterized protein n=1 Tax=Oreochromis aureus TaxID=47969 RepID=A0AAZ1X3N5_OREAU